MQRCATSAFWWLASFLPHFPCNEPLRIVKKRYDSRAPMTPHEKRLYLLADALPVRAPQDVVAHLRRRNVMYFGAGGTLLLATGPEWSDERLVEAALRLFVDDELRRPARRG